MWARQSMIKMILGVCLMNYEIDNKMEFYKGEDFSVVVWEEFS